MVLQFDLLQLDLPSITELQPEPLPMVVLQVGLLQRAILPPATCYRLYVMPHIIPEYSGENLDLSLSPFPFPHVSTRRFTLCPE